MKNEVNRTFTVKKNKFTNFLNCFYANTPQNLGGGNSHSSTVVTPVWKGSKPTVSRRSTDSQSQDHRNHTPISKALKYAAMILMILTLGVGNAWGDPTFKDDYSDFNSINNSTDKYLWIPQSAVDGANWISVNSATTGSKKYSIFIDPSTGIASTDNTSVNFYRPKDKANSKHLTFYLTNITSVSFYAYNSSTNKTLQAKVNGGNAITLATTASNVYSIVGTISGLSASTNYTIEVFNQEASSGASEVYVGAIKVTPASSCSAPTAPTISGTTSYTEGETITLTASTNGSNHSATTTYTWYKGDPWASATKVQNAAVAGSNGHIFTKTAAVEDAGLYWCEAANSTCTSHNATGYEISVSPAPVANPTITGAVNEEGWGSVTDAITVTSGSTISISSNVLTCDEKTLTATATTATAEYTYAFVNWTGVANADEITANVTATANFSRTANSYTLAWDKNAEDADALAGDYTSGTVAYGSDITKPNTPTRDGYDFLGWAETSSGDVVEVPATMPAANKTYYAKWAADPCSEPDKVTNEIARFFVPCGLSNSKGDGSAWTVSGEETSTEHNTFNTYKFGGTASSNWYRNTTSGLIYGKLTDNAGYIQIKLKNDKPFKAGDVVYVYCNRANASKSSVKLHNQSTGNEVTLISTAAGVEASGSYTLVAADVESDGSLKFFRSSSNTFVNRIIVTREPPCVGDPGDISKGTLSAGVLTLNAAGSPVSGDTWYWQTSATGTYQTNSGTSYGVSAAGTYYVRSYNATGTCWSDAKSFTVTAEDLVESFTVVYKDGETTLGSETVEVGEHPSAAGISTTKEFYTFAAWQESGVDKALNDVSAANDETVTLTARYTAQYTSGTYEFTGHLTMGTDPQMTITNSSDGQNYNAGRIDNIYVSAQKIGYEASGDYGGWKLKTTDGTLRFMVENVCGIRVTLGEANPLRIAYTEGGVAKSADIAKKTTSAIYKADANSLVTLTNFTANNKTVTLKKIEILPLYNVTYTDGTGDASGSASNVPEVTLPTPTETIVTVETVDYSFAGWKANQDVTVNDVVKSEGTLLNAGDVAVLGANTTFTAQWAVVVPKYTITKGSHTNGDFTIAPTSQEAGETVTLSATPDEDYVFSAWAVVKTEDGSATGITVSNNTFTMPTYGVTVNATFAADPRQKVLYVTSNSESDTKASDKVYAALKDTYNVKIVGPSSDADQSGYALVVLHESVTGSNYSATAVAAAKTGTTPVLNTKSYFYSSGRWAWGTPNAGKKTKGVHVNTSYCNITSHPLFNDITPDANDSIIILSSISGDNKPIQPIGSFTSGKEGYTLANVPDGCAIHELTPAQRGAVSGKYLLISLYTKDFANLNANGQKLFQNAAAYLIGNTAWEPINVLTSPAVAASPSAAYSVGDDIALTASATGSSAATTYTWYKGDTWAAAEEAGAIQAAATAASNGNTYGITGCASGDAGTYWCVISNGTGCDAKASLVITVSDLAYNISFSSAHGTAPTATTGVSYTLPELSAEGWEHQGWTASIDVTVDAATVTAGTKIANGKIATFGADVTFTAVWAEVFDVTFNMQSHGASIAAQHIVDGGKATEPNDPSAIGWDFGGWYTDAECTEGNEFDFNTAISDDTELFAKWTAFDGCTELWPATSGDAPAAVGDAIVMQSGSNGAAMTALEKPNRLTYTGSGLQFGNESGVKVKVVLNNDMTVGTKISLTLVAGGTGTRGLNLYTKTGSKINAFTCWVNEVNPATNGAEETFTYTVVAEDGLDGTNEFQLWRNNTVCLKSLKVESCGDAVIYHDLASAITPDHDPAYATVTLGASSVREGRTTTATYSDIDPLYEFVSWSVSGEGASIEDASANPATITMGTEDAVVTLNLQLIPVRYTVTYMDGESTLGTEDVDENGHPTASEIATAKEGYIFEGWYNDAELISGPVTLSSVTITAAKTFYGKWVSDGKIRLIANGALNTTDFVTGGTLQDDASYTVEGTIYAKNVQLGGTCNKVGSIDNYNKVIMYNTQTDATNIKIALYDPYSSATTHHAYIVIRQEGNDTPLNNEDVSINTGTKRDVVKEYNITGRATVYVMVSNTNVRVCQVEVTESGSANAVAPAVGYSVNLNQGRMVIPVKDTEVRFEGISYNVAEAYQPARTELKIKTNNTHYISFTIPAGEARQLQLTTSSTSTYAVSQTKGDVTTLITPVANEAQTFNLGEGTWYINPNGSNVSITSIAFDAPQYDLNDDTNVSAILPGADVTVNNGVSLNVDVVKTINDLTIASKAGASGQITGTVTNLTIAGDLYMDVRFFEGAETLDEATAGRWYMISAPFDVNLADGFYKTDGTPMVFGQTDGENIFDLFEYDGNKRASTGVTGWKRVQGKMKAGRACLIGFNPGQPTTIRLKAASTVLSEPTSITLNAYDGDDANRNWNGVANPTMHYTDLNKDVQTYNNEDGENGRKYIAYSASSTSFVVGTAFFVQATGTIDLSEASHSEFRAPQRQANERYEACVQIFRQEATEFADQMYVRASETASNEYEQGHDMITWNGTTANTALIWANNYGKRLAIEEAPLVNDKATYNLGIFAPIAGEYRIEAANPNDDATLYLTKNGRIFWNLTMGACELDLAQGQNNEYGLLLRADAPAVTTGMDEIHSEAGVQKLIIDENIFILHGEQLFDMTGKLVK